MNEEPKGLFGRLRQSASDIHQLTKESLARGEAAANGLPEPEVKHPINKALQDAERELGSSATEQQVEDLAAKKLGVK
jgi:hypothetical protein